MADLLQRIAGFGKRAVSTVAEAADHAGASAEHAGQAADAAVKRIARDVGIGGAEQQQPLGPEAQAELADDEKAVGAAGDIAPDTKARVERAIDAASPDELALLDELLHVPGMEAHVGDFFSGANTVVEDHGALYEKWRQLPSAKERISSHKSKGPQYNVIGPTTGPILFGLSEDGAGTWLQLEGYRGDLCLASAPEILPHMVDYLKYKLTGRNQSRFGSSAHTDAHPVVLQ